ncbi:type II toxin-antitoxin system RelE/ParE family toxin [Tritonibacter mobilis]|uniref:Toxin n=1 Tax=Tritonibacter mobilis F1926 TaxID=1265309 RepID=A0A1B1A0Z3_9RHOB|nr:type II toxin-antitoxin system RelE/ParE family toxin [Tritonibacter mobilis]ANP40211.1 hypothetical protein K529_005470 [Tritonibacter mobilis F1926]KJZ25417.1 hypothetical protein TW79_07135 [Tritonibacter mobilis]
MSQRYALTPEAEEDLIGIFLHGLTTWGRPQARQYHGDLHHTFDVLAENPQAGRTRSELAASIRSFPYKAHVIFYVIERDEVIIARILHGARDIDVLFSR